MPHSTRADIFHYRVATEDEITGSDKHNLPFYLVYCQYCKYQIITKLAGAKCKKCDSFLIKFVAPMMMYPHNELAGSDS